MKKSLKIITFIESITIYFSFGPGWIRTRFGNTHTTLDFGLELTWTTLEYLDFGLARIGRKLDSFGFGL